MSVYLYGITRWPVAPDPGEALTGATNAHKTKGGTKQKSVPSKGERGAAPRAPTDVDLEVGPGVGDPPRPVQSVRHRDLAALVSGVVPEQIGSGQGVRGLRRDMKAHANVLNAAAALGVTVLPVQFGVMLPDPASLIARLLEPQYRSFSTLLTRLQGCVELTFKATYHETQALKEVVATSPQLARAAASLRGRSSPGAYQSRIDLGKRVAEELQSRRDADAQRLLNALAPVVRDARVKPPARDLTVLNASFLVPRTEMDSFDAALAALAEATKDRLSLDCVGPLPPYSFVDLRIG